jgi:hypothetical protein
VCVNVTADPQRVLQSTEVSDYVITNILSILLHLP